MPASRARVRAFRDSVDPTTAENAAAGYKYGDLWVRPGTASGWVLADADAGTWTSIGGGGGGDHAALSNLSWVASLHTGTASRLAGFNGTGAAAYYEIGTGAGQVAAGDHTHADTDALANIKSEGFGKRLRHFDTFIGTPHVSAVTLALGPLSITVSGTSATITGLTSSEAAHPGVLRMTTGTTSTGRAALHGVRDNIRLGGGEWVHGWGVRPADLSTGTQRYQLAVGFLDNPAAVNQTDGCFFLYDEGGVSTGSTASANWQCVTSSGSIRTVTVSSVAVSTSTWAALDVRVNAAGTSVEFRINGTLVATHATNVPTASGALVTVGVAMWKSAGTTEARVDLDYVGWAADLT